ncbi:PREDICTED: uncharacterized protein LOC104809551 isoform X1 [Tarenaya hassleriana]|uniref:uncharacterized protein LOC104809551 isoform X1 n=1 Tax=Tarenaya hassleriana TaxID=28532 RepID=UPI00053C157D|nr:PREDICTED: uncharacterized protein LOC104809551 isoform X1 [Tarenaya hassleriana]
MSGYFPARNWANGQNLVESTKIGRLRVDPKKAHRKEKEKKEKRKDKKERHEKSRKCLEKLDNNLEQQYLPFKKIQDESEQREKSGLTEEHEQPQNLCYLSDGSQSNNKRKRQEPPAVDSHIKGLPYDFMDQKVDVLSNLFVGSIFYLSGKPLRIRFVFRKPKEPEAVPQEERVCSPSVARDTNVSCVPSGKTSEEEENLPSTSRGDESIAITIDTKRKKHKRSKESRYNALFEGWVPPPLCPSVLDIDDEDQDWLFSSKRQGQSTAETVETDKDMTMNLVSSGDPLRPKAQFLSEVGIYALPYTTPF